VSKTRIPKPAKRTHPWRAQGPTAAQRAQREQTEQRVVPYNQRMGVKA
jgi:hypothetical protein